MRKIFLLVSLFCFSVLLFSQSRKITSAEIRWKAYKTLKTESMSHFGTVKLKSGNLTFNGNELTGGSFVIDMNTVDAEDMNGNPKQKKFLENHLKSDDFFDTEKFPVAVFQIKSVKKIPDKNNRFQIGGILNIKGISKNILFPATVVESNGAIIITSAQFTFNRKHFGLKYNIFEDMLISDEVEMNVKIMAQ
ncbi:YceI family protein [Chryseobacterium sp. R2A-55]|uniref:YceI family protein n=1 Tax=Chryseobacterium sp. R2A-55 TaxID=2744445 RepID=UPI001F1F18F3|nr:YceI family protein [Chryseobacterium sp. R2A-55]